MWRLVMRCAWIVAVLAGATSYDGIVVAGSAPAPVHGPVSEDVLYAHDIHADSVSAEVIYAHDVHAEHLQYRQLFESEKDVKGPGEDIHADRVRAREIHAHDIHARSVVVDTLIAHKVE
jgi:hypothetical protein